MNGHVASARGRSSWFRRQRAAVPQSRTRRPRRRQGAYRPRVEPRVDHQPLRVAVHLRHVVKHFKWVPRGSRRFHNKPGAVVIEALLSVARGRNCGDSAANHRCAGSDGGTGLVWKSVPRHLGSRSTDAIGVGDRYARDSAPLGTFVRSRRGMGRTRNPQIRRDFRKVAAMVT